MKILKRMLYRYNSLKLRTLLFIFSIIMISVCIMLSGYFSNKSATEILSKKLEKIEGAGLKQIDNKLSSEINEMERYISNFAGKDILGDYVTSYTLAKDNSIDKMNIKKSILALFENVNTFNRSIDYIELFTEEASFQKLLAPSQNYHMEFRYEDIMTSEIYIKAREAKDSTILIGPDDGDEAMQLKPGSICFGSVIYSKGEETGFLLVVMQSNWLGSLLGHDSNILLYNGSSSKLLWSGSKALEINDSEFARIKETETGSSIMNKNNSVYKISHISSGIRDWVIIKYSNMSEIAKPINKINRYTIFIALLSLSISFVFSQGITTRITKPIYELMHIAARYKAEDRMECPHSGKLNISFRENVMLYFIVMVTMPVLLHNAFFFMVSSRIVEEKARDSLASTFEQTADNIDSFVGSNQRISLDIIFSKDVQDYLISNINSNLHEKAIMVNKIHELVNENKSLLEIPFEAYLFSRDGQALYPSQSKAYLITDSSSYEDIYSSYGEALWSSAEKDRYGRQILSLSKKIKGIVNDEQYNLKTLGFLTLLYNENNINALYQDANISNSNIYLTDESGTVISSTYKAAIGTRVDYIRPQEEKTEASGTIYHDGKRYAVFFTYCSNIPWILVSEIPFSSIAADTRQILLTVLSILLASILAALILSFLLSNYFSAYFTRLTRNLIMLSNGLTDIDFESGIYINEIRELAITFSKMALRVQKTLELEKKKRNAEIAALQAQINPHFLYNTFESIKWMNKKGERDSITTMITSLGDIFRLGISQDKTFIPIQEEINYAKAYVDIQKLRYGSKLECIWHIDGDILQYLTPKLILQPLIENSIYHGIHTMENGGCISIHCYRKQNTIAFKVVDNGLGMDMAQLECIRNGLDGDEQVQHIGIQNVHRRIRLYFGEKYGIFIDSVLGEGTIVMISLPVLDNQTQTL